MLNLPGPLSLTQSVMQGRYRAERRRSRKSVSEEVRTYLCCDIVSRLRQDINCLVQDVKRLTKLKSDIEIQQKEFDASCTELRSKLRNLPLEKIRNSTGRISQSKIMETRDFFKYTWTLVNSKLDKRAKERKFLSIRGYSAIDYIEKVISLSGSLMKKYGNQFHHVECSALYTHLTKQLEELLEPELRKGDKIEFYTSFIRSAQPAMIQYITVIDMYVYTPRLLDLNSLCYELLYGGTPRSVPTKSCRSVAMRVLASYLRGGLLGFHSVGNTAPVVEGRATNFYQLAKELALYTLKSAIPIPDPLPSVPSALLGPGLLEERFIRNLPEIKKVAVAPSPVPPPTLPRASPAPRTSTRGRGRPRKRPIDLVDRQAS